MEEIIKIDTNMKKYLKAVCLLAVTMLMMACDDISGAQPTTTQDMNEYYVRYSISSTGAYVYFSDVTYADVNGTKTDLEGHSVKSWTVTIGPVKKGFRASVKNTGGKGANKIEVCKNSGPFAQKATGTNSASYTIDF